MIIGVTVFIILLILLSLAQEMNRRWQVQREVQRLEQQVRDLQTNVVELENLNQYFRTEDFQERLAREKLNFRAVGEQVVLIPDEELTTDDRSRQSAQPASSLAIPLRWWHIFFVDPLLPSST
jgi:cell division protein FtsB